MHEFLFKLYDYSAALVLENDKKRDQVIGFYTGAISLYLSFGQESFKEGMLFLKRNPLAGGVAVMMLLLVNMVTMQLLLRYRSFHMHCNLGAQVVQRFLANNLTTGVAGESLVKDEAVRQMQKQFNHYFLSIYRYPFSRKKQIFYLLNHNRAVREEELKKALTKQKNGVEKESIGVYFKRLRRFFKGAEILMFLFFVIISTAAIGMMTMLIFGAFEKMIVAVLVQLLLSIWLYVQSLREDRWLSHPQAKELEKWIEVYRGEVAINFCIDVRGLPYETNRK